MRTYLIALSTSVEVKNFLLGDFYKLAKENSETMLVVFVDPEKSDLYRAKFSHARCIIEPMKDIERYPTNVKKVFRTIAYASIPTETIWVRQKYAYLNGGSLIAFCFKRLVWLLGHTRLWRAFIRAIEYYGFHDDVIWEASFTRYKPDAVFGTSVIHEVTITLLKHARRRGVPALGMVKSWDNLSSKGLLRVHPDYLLVQNEIMVREAAEWNDFPKSKIRIVGFPQFDHYYDPLWHQSRGGVARNIGIDPNLKWIVYFAGGLMTGILQGKDSGDHIRMLEEAKKKRVFPGTTFVGSIHPKDAATLKELGIDIPVLRLGKKAEGTIDWDFSQDDMKFLMNVVRHADVTINLGSTMSLEAAIFDRPIVLVGFNGYNEAEVPWQQKLSVALDYTTHYKYVIATGGLSRVNNEKEFIDAVKTYLSHPELHKEGRKRIVKELVGPIDGKAGNRCWQALKDTVEGKF